ncbi:failed axon connections-like isoform X1 [Portunus trituberculatus]|uniref:failed axon connections-like isoform X1 n=1 Tax=Portunus trituberculatus TaxID=210409 RepID=UPI001E1D021A|nr:failed axon connections-like isoform X1 [Portunus trituberculatus]
MTTETETKPVEQTEEKKEEVKEEVKKEEAETNNAEEKADDKAEKADKEKKEEEKKDVKAKKEPAAPKPAVHKLDFNKDVVYLYQFTRTPVLPSLSPYCLKVETWLRIADLKYENVDHKMKYKSKKGQLPFVEVNGEEIADSAIIIKELGTRYNKDLDASLTAEQRNVAHATISMIENHFAWVVKSFIYNNSDSFTEDFKLNLKNMYMVQRALPAIIDNFLFKRKLKAAAKKVRAHGIGVHKPEEIEEFGHNDLMVLSDLLGDKPFFFGDDPTTLDVVAFANLAQVAFMDKEVSYSLRDWMTENCANLVEFCNRVKERAFPDWEEMCTTLDLNSHLPKPPPTEEKAEEPATEKEEKTKEEEKKDEKEKDDTEKEKAQKDEKEGEKEDNKKTEEKEKEEEKK